MPTGPRSRDAILNGGAEAAILVAAALSLLWQYLPLLAAQAGDGQAASAYDPGGFVEQIATGHGEEPYRGRLLVPATLWFMSKASGVNLWSLHVLYFLMVFAAIFFATRWMLTTFGFARSWAIGGALLVSALMPITLRNHFYQPWSWAEAVFYPVAVVLALRKAPIWAFALIVGLAALNRETALFLPLLPLAVAWSRRHWRPYLGMALVGALTAATVRLLLVFVWPGPAATRAIQLSDVLARNLDTLGLAARNVLLLLGAVALLALVALMRRSASPESWWVAVIGSAPLLVIYGIFAIWYEVRVLLPVLILWLPVALAALSPHRSAPAQRPAEAKVA